MNILVIGGTGFIGSHLVESLTRNKEYNVSIISVSDIKTSPIMNIADKVKFYNQDISDGNAVEKLIGKINPDVIVHMAANTNVERDYHNVSTMIKDNLLTTLNIYTASLALNNLKCIITFGTVEEYGQNKSPFTEDQKELSVSPYSFSKTCVTHLSSYFYRIHHLPIVSVRPFLTYGEYQENQFIPYVIKKCLKNETVNMTKGEQTRDFIYVGDVADAIVSIIKKPEKVIGQILNICTGKEIKVKKAALLIKKITGSSSQINFDALQYREGENMHFYGSNKKIASLLNWAPKFSFEDGLRKTIKWYEAQSRKE